GDVKLGIPRPRFGIGVNAQTTLVTVVEIDGGRWVVVVGGDIVHVGGCDSDNHVICGIVFQVEDAIDAAIAFLGNSGATNTDNDCDQQQYPADWAPSFHLPPPEAVPGTDGAVLRPRTWPKTE